MTGAVIRRQSILTFKTTLAVICGFKFPEQLKLAFWPIYLSLCLYSLIHSHSFFLSLRLWASCCFVFKVCFPSRLSVEVMIKLCCCSRITLSSITLSGAHLSQWYYMSNGYCAFVLLFFFIQVFLSSMVNVICISELRFLLNTYMTNDNVNYIILINIICYVYIF